MIDDYKASIGAHAKVVPALLGPPKEGITTGKKDAATAFFNLAVYNPKKDSILMARAVPLLIDLLMDDKAGYN